MVGGSAKNSNLEKLCLAWYVTLSLSATQSNYVVTALSEKGAKSVQQGSTPIFSHLLPRQWADKKKKKPSVNCGCEGNY